MALVLGTILMVGPYSTYASKKFGSFMISDRTLGSDDVARETMILNQSLLTGAMVQLSNIAFERHTEPGREPCASKRKPVERDKCQTKAGVDWIKIIHKEFVSRIPLRIAQMMNPHSF